MKAGLWKLFQASLASFAVLDFELVAFELLLFFRWCRVYVCISGGDETFAYAEHNLRADQQSNMKLGEYKTLSCDTRM